MSSFSQEMLKFLQPELLQPDEMITALTQRGVPIAQLRQLDRPALLNVFRNTAVPKPQRKKHDHHSSDTSTAKTKNKIVINSGNGRHSAADNRIERRESSASNNGKHYVSGSDRLKPPPDLSKSRDYRSEKSQTSCRLKPPPDSSQPESKKIKLNRSSCETLDNVIIKDRSKSDSSRDRHSRDSSSDHSSRDYSSKDHSSRDHSSRDHDSKHKISLANGTSGKHRSERDESPSSSSKKVTLKRNFESHQSSEAPPRKKQPITWP